jgi:hypothetical protein
MNKVRQSGKPSRHIQTTLGTKGTLLPPNRGGGVPCSFAHPNVPGQPPTGGKTTRARGDQRGSKAIGTCQRSRSRKDRRGTRPRLRAARLITFVGDFELWCWETKGGWMTLKLVLTPPLRARKANYWLGWNGQRFANTSDLTRLRTLQPQLYEWLLDRLANHRIDLAADRRYLT